MDTPLQAIVVIALGVGLAAATGFRVFAPLLVAAIAARLGVLPLAAGFDWLAGTPALVILGVAALAETAAYFIPGVDHALDVVAGPAAVAAGVVASASVMTDVPAHYAWPIAIIAGGGVAGIARGGAALVRAKAALATGGLANPLVALAETVGSAGLAVLAIAVPLACAAVVVVLSAAAARAVVRIARRRRPSADR